LVLNEETGITEAIINADALTAVRTAAGKKKKKKHV
jgi:ornithine cyclodeaminase